MPASHPLLRLAAVATSAVFVAACSHLPAPLAVTPTFVPGPATAQRTGPLVVGPTQASQHLAPGPVPPITARAAAQAPAGTPPALPKVTESLSLEQVSLPNFINEVFSKTLKLNVQIDQAVMTRNDLVTLRTGRTLSGSELFAMAVKVLAGYGIGASWDGEVLRVAPDSALMAQMPELIHSRALPEMPVALRPIFQIIDLHQVSATDMLQWLSNAYGAKIRAFASPRSDAIMVFGLPVDVRAAVEAIRVLDQARLAGRESLRVNPVYWTARAFAAKLVEVLRAEGYDAGTTASPAAQGSAITLVPVEANNSLIVFAADPKVLAHVRQWIDDLDQPGQIDPGRNIFIYSVQNTTAASLGRIVQSVLGGTQTTVSAPAAAQLEQAGRTQSLSGALGDAAQTGAAAAPAQQRRPAEAEPTEANPANRNAAGAGTGPGPRIVIDSARNAIVLVGTAQDYQRIRPLLEALDKAPREALIEVTVVELDLSDTNNLGVEWTFTNRLGGGATQRLGTGPNVLPGTSSTSTGGTSTTGSSGAVGLPLGTEGFNYTILNGVGDVRLLLNAFAQNSKVNVLSTPRILAESGGTANIEVGTEVPIITSQGTTNTIQNAGTSGILQSIEYRKTGVLLSVQPVVHSSNRIDLTLSQVVSQALPNSTPGISSPLIQNRTVSTQLSLQDGQTVVIGGLITQNRSDNDTGVPYLKDIPGLGLLFRNQAVSNEKNELLVFITPYVVSNDTDAAAITRQFQQDMRKWPIPSTQLQW
jgi:general secretion pathway protein D